MKLVHPEFNYRMEFKENKINLVVIEDKKLFRNYIKEIYNQSIDYDDNGRFVLSDNEKEIKLSKKLDVILDYYTLNINNKKILLKVYNKLREISIEEDMYIKTNKLNSEIIRYIDDIIDISDFPLEFSIDINIIDILKISNVRFVEDYENDLEKICHYIDLVKEVTGKNIFAFINFREFFELDEIRELYKFASYKKIYLIMFENHINDICREYEEVFILDKDICEIY
ncbi:type II-A CRISPR-associated protein Csn2 [Peptacetobacter sp.]|uniref:type II-A CRISPR-associated protein Csn2 n=1 Tax=Peptacetobacter sp. TaxID=2991975 RepID=UPI00262486CE|nr:type II-A CRISPR-associated protein Csn2 [Peptacetobacter sp.]